jgi:hypothetical protein
MATRKKIKIESKELKSIQLLNNIGQLEGLPSNPRFIRSKEFEELKRSIQEDPEMLDVREVVVYPFNENFIIIAGNMRYQALLDLGIKQIPCKILPKTLSIEKLRAISIKDNIHSGKDDWDMIANDWESKELENWGKRIPFNDIAEPKKTSNIRITIEDVNEDERDTIRDLLINSGYKVK